VIELLLVTTIPAMLLAARGVPSLWLVLATLVGGSMAAGSANALNCVADADIDAEMQRTRARPLVTHQIPVRHALIFGIALGMAAFGWLWVTTNGGLAGLGDVRSDFFLDSAAHLGAGNEVS
jgi:protoheme IX farnesyltransferase